MTTLLGRSPALAGRRRLSGHPLAVAIVATIVVAVMGIAPGLFWLAAGTAQPRRSASQTDNSLQVVERDTVAMIEALAKPGAPDAERLRQHLLQAIDRAAEAIPARNSPPGTNGTTELTGDPGVAGAAGGAASHFGPAQRAVGYARAALGYARAGAIAGDARLLARGRDLLRLAQRLD